MEINKDFQFNVEELKQQLLRQRITKPRFRWNLSQEQAQQLLTAAYCAQVEFRGHKPIMDKATQSNIQKVATHLTAPNPKFGILLCGVYGNGKTTMLYAFQQATNYLSRKGMLKEYQNEDARVGITIIDAREIAEKAKDYASFSKVKRTFMLGMEDIGREPTEVLDFGNILNPVTDLLEYRYNEQLFTFVTTNLTPKQIRQKYGNRIADRFNEMMACIVFENQTYRK